ncbi:hypothetical protein [Lysinibacillus sp. G4S2]|uniref:hypothetical protein n=1 Tax=Lysinibacillus sp. G4S2 TaxID=3055859 RepID=UPI0025A274CE|nr:hypothetical protein [Lysinibacillus sp. G4S2]MDM5248194.1 hypothetical protein [Lysinibacillus sp. G4S2]
MLARRKPCSVRQRQIVLFVRKRSVSDKLFYLCESEASATNCLSALKAKRQRQMFYLCESEASATNVLSVRKRSVGDKCFICAKAKRQRQMFYLCRKRSVSDKMFYLCESEASATKRVARSGNQILLI